MENWQSLESIGFPGYSISDHGEVMSQRTNKLLRLSTNNTGIVRVGLMKTDEARQMTLSLPRLVALMFVPGKSTQFTTPIHLNGDREDNRAANLAWRPRWFAIKFMQQFEESDTPLLNNRIYDVETSKEFAHSREAAIEFGLIEADIMKSVVNGTPCFPTWQRFAQVLH